MKKKKLKKLEWGGAAFEKLANALARDYVAIRQCMKCTHPVVHGYCCTFCGDTNPSERPEEGK